MSKTRTAHSVTVSSAPGTGSSENYSQFEPVSSRTVKTEPNPDEGAGIHATSLITSSVISEEIDVKSELQCNIGDSKMDNKFEYGMSTNEM